MSSNRSRLLMVTQELCKKWDETKNQWRDSKSMEFEHKYIEELVAGVDVAAGVIEKLDKLVTKIRSDCE